MIHKQKAAVTRGTAATTTISIFLRQGSKRKHWILFAQGTSDICQSERKQPLEKEEKKKTAFICIVTS